MTFEEKYFDTFFPCTKCLWKNGLYIYTNPSLKVSSMNYDQMEGYYKKKLSFVDLFNQHYFTAIIVWDCSEKISRYPHLT